MQALVSPHAPERHADGHGPPQTAEPGATAQRLKLPVTLKPHPNLLRYNLLTALVLGPFIILAAVPMYFRYRTLRYDVDGEGITMRWGILFRREVSLAYARIQDIQLTSNVLERWLGLARIQLQTASGSSSAEMTIEGILDVEAMRDFLYSRMRGTADPAPAGQHGRNAADLGPLNEGAGPWSAASAAGRGPAASVAEVAQLTAALDAVAAELRALRSGMTSAGLRGGEDA
jgi:putative membrane protein